MKHYFLNYKRQLIALVLAVFVLSLLPVVDVYRAVGNGWQGVPPVYSDEDYYYARMHEVKDGYPFLGNPYFYEHRNDPAPTFFVPDWMAAVPLVLGASLPVTLVFNFSLWSIIFALIAFLILCELRVHKNLAALGAFLLYIQSYALVLRPVSLQQIFPFFLLLILATLRWYRAPDIQTRRILFAVAIAATFYMYAYLWQITAVMAFLLLAGFFVAKDWMRFKNFASLFATALLLALPALVYTAVQIGSPFYWETVQRIGLVYTHLPTAEVVYSGGWVIFTMLAFLFLWRRIANADRPALAILSALGFALVLVQASNLITGKEVETAIHVKRFIIPWLGISLAAIAVLFSQSISELTKQKTLRWIVSILVIVLCVVNIYFAKDFPALFNTTRDVRIQKLQTLAAPFQYLDNAEKSPVVVWVASPESDFSYYLPALTKDYVLYSHPGMWHLVSDHEVIERYLTANYFHPVTKESLVASLGAYAGPAAAWHRANTVNRGVRLCQIFQLERFGYSCGKLVTPEEVLGEGYFDAILQRQKSEVQPHIRELLAKYHVSYLVTQSALSPAQENLLRAQVVYHDQNYVIYRVTTSKQ